MKVHYCRWQRGRNADFKKDLPVAHAIGTGHADKNRTSGTYAFVSIDDAGNEPANPDDEYLASQTNTKPIDDQRNPGQSRDGPYHFKDRPEKTFSYAGPAHDEAKRYTGDKS